MLKKRDVVRRVLQGRPVRASPEGTAFAPANIALCKYWGKRDEELNLPVTSSLSVSLGSLGSRVSLTLAEGADVVELNGTVLGADTPFTKRATAFLDLFRPDPSARFRLSAENTIPTAAGFASSASGFAALVLALDRLFGWGLDRKSLSILARLGSGSACRSVHEGFVEWHAGQAADGMDSCAERLDATWPDLRMGLLVVSDEEKSIGSRPAMKHTVETSPLYTAWPAKVEKDLAALKDAIRRRDFPMLGRTAESNALAMHATMIAAWPPVLYWLPDSVHAMQRIRALRDKELELYFTMDAGPNLKLLFEEKDTDAVTQAFPEVEVVAPFANP
ncbi:MAG: diphosphomevalonate decarboxylase [Verrucomicrobiota bacterium]